MADKIFIEIVKFALTLVVAITTLGLGWFVGQRLTYRWNVRQKRREAQLSISQQFYSAYGEFFAVWKLWNRLDQASANFEDRRWELQKRAAAAEATIEGILVKLSSELRLDHNQIATVGCYRQGFQQLRESIHKGERLMWQWAEDPPYLAFKKLASRLGGLLASEWPEGSPNQGEAERQLQEITSNQWEKVWVPTALQRDKTEAAPAST